MTSFTRLKRVATLQAGGTPPVDDPTMWMDDGIPWVAIGDMTRSTIVTATDRSVSPRGIEAKRLHVGSPGTVLFAMYASVGATGVLGVRAVWNQAILGISPKPGRSDSRYVRYWLEYLRSDLPALTRSNTQDNLNAEQVGNLPFPLLDVRSQRAIADYLDAETARIDALIVSNDYLAALVEEKRQAVITQAVTKGMDSTIPTKESGLDWLGEVPTHWDVCALSRRWNVIDCKHLTVDFVDEGVPVASVVECQTFDLDLTNAKRTSDQWYRHMIEGGRLPRVGDVIYCRNVSVGASTYVGPGCGEFAIGQDVCLIRSYTESGRYLNYLLHSHGMGAQLDQVMVGATFNRINVADIRRLVLPVPPVGEQRKIVDHLDGVVRRLDSIAVKILRVTELLREYRVALITACVSGQRDIWDLDDAAENNKFSLERHRSAVARTGTIEQAVPEVAG